MATFELSWPTRGSIPQIILPVAEVKIYLCSLVLSL
jgi:hypothetical protein